MPNLVETEKNSDTRSFSENKIKNSKSEVLQNNVKEMKKTVKTLEASVTESDLDDQRMVRQLRLDNAKNQRVTTQLEEARKENKQLLNILQQSSQEKDSSRSQVDISSAYSTMSMVNLQYKYEELLDNYEGVLKILAEKDKDMQRCYSENESLRDEMNSATKKCQDCERSLRKVCSKYLALRDRKNAKISQLSTEKETLRLAHNQVVKLLHQQCMKNDAFLAQKLHKAAKPERALFLQEIQRSNKLQHENMLLTQEIACLKSRCSFKNVRFSLGDAFKERAKSNTQF